MRVRASVCVAMTQLENCHYLIACRKRMNVEEKERTDFKETYFPL